MVATAALCLAGCAIDVDLASTPSAAKVGEPIDFDISVRNRFSCPVGGVVALLVPFVPKNTFINQIDDPGVREVLSEFVAAFCSGEDVFPPDGSGGCRIEDGELICELDPGIDLPGALPEAAVATTPGGDDITCRGDGAKIVCRFPRAVVDLAMAQQAVSENSLGSLQCAEAGEFAICGAALLDPNETKSSEVRLDVPYGGMLRNWVVSFATVRGGVCTGGVLKRRPCEDDDDCPGMGNTCGTGLCVAGELEGYGCVTDGDCGAGGDCSTCDLPDDDGQLLAGVACTTTSAPVSTAPAASPWALAALTAALGGVGVVTVRRLASSRRRRVR